MLKQINIDQQDALVFLPGVKLFIKLDNHIIGDIAERMSMHRYEAGEKLIGKDEAGEFMLIIKQGKVKVSLEDRDVKLGRGDVLGEIALLSGTPSKADVIAQTDAEALALHRDDFQILMEQHTELATVMTDLMKSRMFGANGINRLGKYRILSQLGEGGMSVVYNAKDTVLGREVAIKMLKYEIASRADFKKRFKQEAVTIAKLTHPNILHVIETIDDYSTSFIVMEKLDGYDLKYYLQEQGVFSGKQTCDIISQLAQALEYAGNRHNGGIIHRDIKPANIVLDYQGNVKLMDFGIATTSEQCNKNFEGTILYTAPEVLQKKTFDYRIDIYALAVTAYAMLTGKTPFRAPSMLGIMQKTINEEAKDIRTLVPDVPEGLAEFINRALIKDPDQRISDWSEIQSLLASGKGYKVDLLANTEMDMAVVLKFKTAGIDTGLLLKELHQVLKLHHASYDMEVVERDSEELDFTL
ncbi:MAG TPA: cyclic nucleotide-binding domain-containing protein [Gammaproteobacteria bacterium]|nr:cyclic nucleotide-binding domain-containing protein [Gammaproteobacteria bacterium]